MGPACHMIENQKSICCLRIVYFSTHFLKNLHQSGTHEFFFNFLGLIRRIVEIRGFLLQTNIVWTQIFRIGRSDICLYL